MESKSCFERFYYFNESEEEEKKNRNSRISCVLNIFFFFSALVSFIHFFLSSRDWLFGWYDICLRVNFHLFSLRLQFHQITFAYWISKANTKKKPYTFSNKQRPIPSTKLNQVYVVESMEKKKTRSRFIFSSGKPGYTWWVYNTIFLAIVQSSDIQGIWLCAGSQEMNNMVCVCFFGPKTKKKW